MTSLVTINFSNCTFDAEISTIFFGNGGSIDIGGNDLLQIMGTFTYSTFNISRTQMMFMNNAVGGPVNGVLNIPVRPGTGSPTTLLVSNFTGRAYATWMADGAPNSIALVPGEPLPLNGLS